MIHLDNASEVFLPKNMWVWFVAAFKAGFINSAGFLASGMFVSHMTGFGTQAGIALGTENYFFSLELLIIPFFFILGGVTTSLILDHDYKENEVPPYWMVQGLITVLIGGILFMGTKHTFKGGYEFGIQDFALMAMLCMVCGLKNSLISWTTYGRVKVTHLTGISTDLGLHLVRSFYPKQPAPRGRESRIVNISRFMTLLSFTAGAGISAILFPLLGFKVFYIVFVISVVMTVYALYHARRYAKNKLHLSVEPLKN